MSEIFSNEKSPVEELRDLLPGTDGFDFGTSPHGLAVDLRRTQEEARQEAAPLSLADGFDLSANTAPTVAALAANGVAGEPKVFCLTDEQRCHLAYAALCQIFELEESDESEEPGVLEGIRLLEEARKILDDGRSA